MRTNVGLTGDEKKLLYAVFLNGPLSREETEEIREELLLIGKHFRTNSKKFAEDGVRTVMQVPEKLSGPVLVLFTLEEEGNQLIVSGKPFPTDDIEESVDVVSYGFLFPFIRRVVEGELKEREVKKLMAVVSLSASFSRAAGIEGFNVVEAESENGMFSFTVLTPYGALILFRFPRGTKEEEVYAFMGKYLYSPENSLPAPLREEISEHLKEGPAGVGVLYGTPLTTVFAFPVSSELSHSLKADVERMLGFHLSSDEDVLKVIYFQEVYGTVFPKLEEIAEGGRHVQ